MQSHLHLLMRRLRFWLIAWASMLQHHLRLWRAAWGMRRQLEGSQWQNEEAEFLASALALQKSPPSPAPRVALGILSGFSLLALLWACLGQVDIVATAHGRVIASGKTKTVQAFETASVSAIHVHEGQVVQAGELLLELNATAAMADMQRLGGEWQAARLQMRQAQALYAAWKTNREPQLQRDSELSPAQIGGAQQQISATFHEYVAKRATLEAEIARYQAELQATHALRHKLEQSLPITRQRAIDFAALSQKNFVSRHAWQEKEQARIEQEGELAVQISRVQEIGAALNEGQSKRASLVAESAKLWLANAAEAQQRAASLQQEWRKAQLHQELMQIRAPIAGTVQQLAVSTLGGVVTPAQALMMIVPDDAPVEIDALLENKDVGFVVAHQSVEVKVEAFPYTRYGVLRGSVVRVSRDAIADDQRGLNYLVRVRLLDARMHVKGRALALSPGMAVSAEIQTGRRRVIDYLLSPLSEHLNESLRER